MKELRLAFVGNPNCGKTTLFNAFTGANQKVANWPGVTVCSVCGKTVFGGTTYFLTDLPGIYAISSYSEEEKVAMDYLSASDDVIINVTDATNLERNLYLTLQLLELEKPVVLALNMTDILEKKGICVDEERLGKILGIKAVKISAKKKSGLSEILRLSEKAIFPDGIVHLKNEEVNIADMKPKERYILIEKILKEVLSLKEITLQKCKPDRLLTHNVWGLPIFLGVMGIVFFLTFFIGEYIKSFFENWLESFIVGVYGFLTSKNFSGAIVSLVCEGIIPGVGGMLTFLPNIAILFLLLGFLEDSGYMSRVCYVMDSIMSKAGLSGKAFIPMILGFGCSVPAILATRTLEDKRDRIKTIFAIPFMSCSAKLPIYVMLSKLFFGKYAPLLAYSMYLLSFLTSILILFFLCDKEKKESTLLVELPEYKMPDIKTVSIYVLEKVKDYLAKAGTTIFFASVFLWIILHIGKGGLTDNIAESFGASLGKMLVPVMKPCGLGYWQIIVSLIWGVAAKEAVVSGMSVLYGISNISSPYGMAKLTSVLKASGFCGLNAYTMMLFCFLYTPCIAAIATASGEIKSRKTLYTALFVQLLIAWGVSFVFYRIGRIIF